jgi:hypothetical protein
LTVNNEIWTLEEGAPQHANELANHNCNFYRLKARVLLPSTPVMTHSVCVVAKPRPAGKSKPSAGRGAYTVPATRRSDVSEKRFEKRFFVMGITSLAQPPR